MYRSAISTRLLVGMLTPAIRAKADLLSGLFIHKERAKAETSVLRAGD
tara:strand:- start:426 stop:569 length:144 start_codon:yes stop_codon:yes gene_type:complete